MKSFEYNEAKVTGIDYVIIYKIVDKNVYILGICCKKMIFSII